MALLPARPTGPPKRTTPRRPRSVARAAGILILVVQCLPAALAQESEPADPTSPQYTEEGAGRCLLCHASLRMTLIAETPHGDASNPETPFGQHGCESCHGPGSFHVGQSRRGQGRPPMIVFGEGARTPREQQVEVCMGCHIKHVDELLKIDGHANARVSGDMMNLSCSTCHTIHQVTPDHAEQVTAESALLAERLTRTAEFTERGTQQCLLCHADQRMHGMAKTVHGNATNPATPYGQQGCESCHGRGSLHVNSPAGGDRPVMITFGENAATPVSQQKQTCMNCHRDDWDAMLAIDAHRKSAGFDDVSCATCHTLHPVAQAAPQGTGAPAPNATFTTRGAEQCLLCHSDDRVTQIQRTPHGDRSNPHSPFAQQECESCHGPGSIHVSQSSRGDGRPPMIEFGREGHTPISTQVDTCLGCHDRHEDGFTDLSWAGMVHGRDGVCTDCHQVHTEANLLTSTTKEVGACLDCHSDTAGAAPHVAWAGSMHENDQVSCRSCHTVHVAGSLLENLDGQTENCAACHAGPDLGVAAIAWTDSVHANGDLACASCHTVHAEFNVLKDRQIQAETCYGCHEDRRDEHPRFADKAIVFDSLNCTTCHDVHQLVPRQHAGGTSFHTTMEQR